MSIGESRIRDLASEERLFRDRLMLSVLVVFACLVLLGWRYTNLQVFNFEKFATESDRNRIHTLPVAPKRGLIYDRNGKVVAQNQPTHSLVLTIERIADFEQTLFDLQQLFDINEEAIEKFKQRTSRRKPYQAVPLLFKLNDDEISRFSVNRFRLPGVEVAAQLTREYPMGKEFAHVLGYVGRINEKDQEKLLADPEKKNQYAATSHIGKLGVEAYYEEILHGGVGSQHVETNAHGRVLRVLDQRDPQPGRDLVLTIDADLQSYIHKVLDKRRASVVVIDIRTGGLLAMVSTPSYDANAFVKGISRQHYAELSESIDLPLFNRSLQGQYPPGSTIKPMIGLAGLHHGLVDRYTSIPDPGWYKLPNDDRLYRDWKRTGHGSRVNMHSAVVESCDVYFYDLAFNLGIDRIHPFLSYFQLGERTGIDSTSEAKGLVPSRTWKRGTKNIQWFPGETLNIGIGQGYMLTTPLQLAVATAVVATRGEPIQPHLVSNIPRQELRANSDIVAEEDTYFDGVSHLDKDSGLDAVDPDHWNQIQLAMRDVIHSRKGTAQSIEEGASYMMAGKTGTAQVIGIAQGEEYDEEQIAERQRDHALFVGYVPYQKPEIAVAVIVENGGGGGSTAAPVARKVFDWYMDRRERRFDKPQGEQGLYANYMPQHRGLF